MKVYKYDQSDKEKAASKLGKYSHAKGDRGEMWLKNHGERRLDRAELSEHFAIIQKRQNKGDKFLPEYGIVPRWDFFDHIIHGESKWCERLSLYAAYEQALNASKVGAIPTVFHRRKNKPVLAVEDIDDWWDIFEVYLWFRLAQHKGLSILKQCPFFRKV
jgi:hypothetical protein